MVKRKSSAPLRLNENQQNELRWNYQPGVHPLGLGLPTTNTNIPQTASLEGENDCIASSQLAEKKRKTENISSYAVSLVLKKEVSLHSIDGVQSRMLGSIAIHLDLSEHSSRLRTDWSSCEHAKLCLSHRPYKLVLYIANDAIPVGLNEPLDYRLLNHLKNSCFALQMEFDDSGFSIKVFLLLNSKPCHEPITPNKDLKAVMNHFFPAIHLKGSSKSHNDARRQDIDALYRAVKQYHALSPVTSDVSAQHSSLNPQLRQYQHDAVRWMYSRETNQVPLSGTEHCLYTKLPSQCSRSFYYNKYVGAALLDEPTPPTLPTGGILADEMGLGKTVEVLALILANRFPCTLNDSTMCEGSKICEDSNKCENSNKCEESKVCENSTKFEDKIICDDSNTCKDTTKSEDIMVPEDRNMCDDTNKYHDSKMCEVSETCDASTEMNKDDKIYEGGINVIGLTSNGVLTVGNGELTNVSKKSRANDVGFNHLQGDSGRDVFENEKTTVNQNEIKKGSEVDICTDSVLHKTSAGGRVTKRKKQPFAKLLESVTETIEWVARGLDLKRKPSLMREAATRWYNSQLAATSAIYRPTVKRVLPQQDQMTCLCGQPVGKKKIIQCLLCKTWQHCECVGVVTEPFSPPYYCPQCWQNKECMLTGATLIVSPVSISQQWVTEMTAHIAPGAHFKRYVYNGVAKCGFVQPSTLAQYDVVLTTYETLRKELNYAELNPRDTDKLRHTKRFVSAPSPLTCLRWWRVCLDEAQMVHSSKSKVSEMARRLPAQHRWAITGTPLHKDINELLGTVQFLGVEPYTVSDWWHCLVSQPHRGGNTAPLYSLMGQIMWRSCKKDVLEQIKIPSQNERLHWVLFSPVEEFFYQRQHEKCSSEFSAALQRLCASYKQPRALDMKLSSLDRHDLNVVLAPLLRLRQACAHPQVVRGNYVNVAGSALTMEELLESLIKKAALESAEALRQQVAALNGMAAIYQIQNSWEAAVDAYRDVLRLWQEYEDRFSVDTLQLIHTCANLAEVLAGQHAGVAPTLRDDSLGEQAATFQDKYMQRYEAALVSNRSVLATLTTSVTQSSAEMESRDWWSDIITVLLSHGDEEELMSRLIDSLAAMKDNRAKQSIMSSVRGMSYELGTWLARLDKARDKALGSLDALQGAALDGPAVEKAVNCHIRGNPLVGNKKDKDKCQVCLCEDSFLSYERSLFPVLDLLHENTLVGDVVIFGQRAVDTWKPTVQEMALKTLIAIGRARRVDDQLLFDGTNHLKMLETMKKEFRRARAVWSQLRDQIAARDELRMCRTRLRLKVEGEVIKKEDELTSRHIIDAGEVPYQLSRLESEREVAIADLRRKSGQLGYLTTLRTKPDLGLNPDPCPICRSNLGKKWSVLQCGHVYCMECVLLLHKVRTVKCAVCREKTEISAVSYVNLAKASDETSDLPLKGSHSAKVQAVLRCLLALVEQDSEVKVLIFSAWEKVLDVLEVALEQNQVQFRRLTSGKVFQINLHCFKTDPSITALLLPLRSGSKGLNLTEATHLMFIEPILEPGHELQALGRIHRIGQTKKTTIHRFLMLKTVEEQIHLAVRAHSDQWEDDQVTLDQLHQLFSAPPPAPDELSTDQEIVITEQETVATNGTEALDELLTSRETVKTSTAEASDELSTSEETAATNGAETPDELSIGLGQETEADIEAAVSTDGLVVYRESIVQATVATNEDLSSGIDSLSSPSSSDFTLLHNADKSVGNMEIERA